MGEGVNYIQISQSGLSPWAGGPPVAITLMRNQCMIRRPSDFRHQRREIFRRLLGFSQFSGIANIPVCASDRTIPPLRFTGPTVLGGDKFGLTLISVGVHGFGKRLIQNMIDRAPIKYQCRLRSQCQDATGLLVSAMREALYRNQWTPSLN